MHKCTRKMLKVIGGKKATVVANICEIYQAY